MCIEILLHCGSFYIIYQWHVGSIPHFQVIEFGEFSKQLKIDLSGVKIEMVFGEIKMKRILSKSDTVGKYIKSVHTAWFHITVILNLH